MGLLNGTDNSYYNTSSEHGEYQFTSLEDIVNQFMFVYVGEDKVITKVNKLEVGFHAQRALAEMSFDVFKSIKAQQIEIPPSLTMILPRDYVNYTKLSWVDSAGIKHRLYPTSDNSNPFQVLQSDDGSYEFPSNENLFANSDFTSGLDEWTISAQSVNPADKGGVLTSIEVNSLAANPAVNFQTHAYHENFGAYGFCTYIYQQVDASELENVSFKANATTTASSSITITAGEAAASINSNHSQAGTFTKPGSTVRVGLSSQAPSEEISMNDYTANGITYYTATTNANPSYFDLGYIEWTQGETGEKTYDQGFVDLSNIDGPIYLVAMSIIDHVDSGVTGYGSSLLFDTATVDDISIFSSTTKKSLSEVNPGLSSTFSSYNAGSPSENNNVNDYENNIYWPNQGERYGLDPQRAQVNGSFYIDDRQGKINFSSNISGKTVILDYISDSLGTDGEMQVHKFAEEAMYKAITYGVLSTKSNIPEMIVRRAKKEKFASTRQAKLRLSSIKLGEITQILRGKSKQIKH